MSDTPAPLPEGMETTAEERRKWGAMSYDRVAGPVALWHMVERLCRDLDRALAEIARLTAERATVPPDREMLITSLAKLGTELMDAEWDAVELINDTIDALRSPAPTACEEMARHLLIIAGSGVSLDYDRFILREAAAALRSPADGWREGAEAMREACAKSAEHAGFVEAPMEGELWVANRIAAFIRALPIPFPPAEEKTP